MGISGWVMSILIALFAICCAAWSIVYMVCGVKCVRKKDCTNEKCCIRYFCDSWSETYTEEDRMLIEKMMEELGKDGEGTNRVVLEQDDNYRKIIDNILRIAVDIAALSFIGMAVWIVVMGIMIRFR